MIHVGGAHHVHVKAGIHGKLCGMGFIGRITVHYHLVDAGVVAHHKTLEAPLILQDFIHEVVGSMGGDTVKFIEGSHYAECAGVNCGLVGREVEFPEPALAHIHCVVVPSGLGGAVCGKVLHAGKDGVVL